jgi:hypothetical protein
MSFDFSQLRKSKRALRERLAARPLMEKLRLLDAMRERAISIRAAKSAPIATAQEQPPDHPKKQ